MWRPSAFKNSGQDASTSWRSDPGLMQRWESVCRGGIPLLENRKVGSIYRIDVSCFWSIWNSYPSFWNLFWTKINHLPILVFYFSCFQNINISKSQKSEHSKVRHVKKWYLHFPIFRKFSNFLILRHENEYVSTMLPHFSCIFWNILMINTGSTGPLRVHTHRKLEKFQKSSKKYCNMSGDISILSTSGPVDLLTIIEILLKIQDKSGTSLKHIILGKALIHNFGIFGSTVYLTFSRVFFFNVVSWKYEKSKMRIGKWSIFH